MRQRLRDVLTPEQDAALVRRLEAREHAQQRGLAATAWAQQREELPGLDIERDAVNGAERPKCLGDGLDAQQRLSGCGRVSIGSTCRGVRFRQFVRHASCKPRFRRTLAADRLLLNRVEPCRPRLAFMRDAKRRIITNMTKLQDQALEIARSLPSDAEDDIARIALQLAGADAAPPVILSDD